MLDISGCDKAAHVAVALVQLLLRSGSYALPIKSVFMPFPLLGRLAHTTRWKIQHVLSLSMQDVELDRAILHERTLREGTEYDLHLGIYRDKATQLVLSKK